MSLLIAVKSCHEHRLARYNEVIRSTWKRDLTVQQDLFFFHGFPTVDTPTDGLQRDEITLPVKDDYDSLPFKTLAILDYFLRQRWEYIFLCDTDTYVVPAGLNACNFQNYDVSGRYGEHPAIGTTFQHRDDRRNLIEHCHPWPSGGVGYFLSRKAAGIVLDNKYDHWAEDFMVGQTTGPYIQRGELNACDLPEFEAQVAWHFQRRQYNGQVYHPKFGWMDRMYEQHGRKAIPATVSGYHTYYSQSDPVIQKAIDEFKAGPSCS